MHAPDRGDPVGASLAGIGGLGIAADAAMVGLDHSTALKAAMQIDGALGVALVDGNSGMALATAGAPIGLDLEMAAAANSNIVQATRVTMRDLGLSTSVEDILITVSAQYHIIRPLIEQEGLFLYLVLDRNRASLAAARWRLAALGNHLTI